MIYGGCEGIGDTTCFATSNEGTNHVFIRMDIVVVKTSNEGRRIARVIAARQRGGIEGRGNILMMRKEGKAG